MQLWQDNLLAYRVSKVNLRPSTVLDKLTHHKPSLDFLHPPSVGHKGHSFGNR